MDPNEPDKWIEFWKKREPTLDFLCAAGWATGYVYAKETIDIYFTKLGHQRMKALVEMQNDFGKKPMNAEQSFQLWDIASLYGGPLESTTS
jgi:hypothetical protein